MRALEIFFVIMALASCRTRFHFLGHTQVYVLGYRMTPSRA
jgi:hypothetical protein